MTAAPLCICRKYGVALNALADPGNERERKETNSATYALSCNSA